MRPFKITEVSHTWAEKADIRYKGYARGRFSCQKGIFLPAVTGGSDSSGLSAGRHMRMRGSKMKDASECNSFHGCEVITTLLYHNTVLKTGSK